jgi:hypothetical protein
MWLARRLRARAVVRALIVLSICQSARAVSQIFNITANGIKEVSAGGVPNGDPDGLAVGTVQLDNGTGSGTTGSAIINITITNVDFPLTGHHIHQGPITSIGGIVLDFGNPESFRSGNTITESVSNLSAATINNVFANPSAFYYNIHNIPFGGGAVRDQLTPEPGVASLIAVSVIGLLRRRRA